MSGMSSYWNLLNHDGLGPLRLIGLLWIVVLFMVAYNMSEWRVFVGEFRGRWLAGFRSLAIWAVIITGLVAFSIIGLSHHRAPTRRDS